MFNIYMLVASYSQFVISSLHQMASDIVNEYDVDPHTGLPLEGVYDIIRT